MSCEDCGDPATHKGYAGDVFIYACCTCNNDGHWFPCDGDCEVIGE